MIIWKHSPKDSKRVRILKNVASHIHSELLESAGKPISPLQEMREQLMANDIARLNRRIKRTIGREVREATQLEMSFDKKRRTHQQRTGKIYIKELTQKP